MYKIVHTGAGRDAVRVESDAPLTPDDFKQIAKDLGRPLLRAHKTGYVSAREARVGEVVETRWNGKETTNTARKGDWVVVNLGPDGKALRDREGHENTYIIAAKRFDELYERASLTNGKSPDPNLYRAKSTILALRLPGGFDVAAPWGERQQAPDGYLILSGDEIYGNNAETFAATYDVLAS